MFDHKERDTYEETTAPLRELLIKGAKFSWKPERVYSTLMRMMSSDATLRPYTTGLTTMYVSDASPYGIAASVYQVEWDGTWVPIDHISPRKNRPGAAKLTGRVWQSPGAWNNSASTYQDNISHHGETRDL